MLSSPTLEQFVLTCCHDLISGPPFLSPCTSLVSMQSNSGIARSASDANLERLNSKSYKHSHLHIPKNNIKKSFNAYSKGSDSSVSGDSLNGKVGGEMWTFRLLFDNNNNQLFIQANLFSRKNVINQGPVIYRYLGRIIELFNYKLP